MPAENTLIKTGLIGRSIGASRSPAIHEGEAVALGLNLSYSLTDFSALGLRDEDLPDVVASLRDQGFAGANITFPFKQRIIAHCDTLGTEAALMGAVNTLSFADGQVHGENSDWLGFTWMICREIGDVAGSSVAQVGAGGAGSATALALAKLGVRQLAIFDPDDGKADALVARLAPHFPDVAFTAGGTASATISGADGIVNATPIGMAAHPGMPFNPQFMSADQWLADIIYFPLETELVRHARSNGHRTANGVSMVVGQAAEAFRIFTRIQPDRERMFARLMLDIEREAKCGGLAA